jgi:hypothetical protein
MKQNPTSATVLALGLVLPMLPTHALALEQGVTGAGVAYLSGGVDAGEQRFLEDMRAHYSVWLIARSKGSGRALDGVRVRVIDARDRRLVFDRTLDAPWLLLDLPSGRYQVEASFGGEVQRWSIAPQHGDALPHALYLDVAA